MNGEDCGWSKFGKQRVQSGMKICLFSFRTEVCVWNREEKSFMLEKKFGGLKS